MFWDSQTILGAIHQTDPSYRVYFLENWGRNLCWRMGLHFDHQIAALDFAQRISSLAKSIPQEERPYFYYGLTTRPLLDIPPRITEDCFRSIRAEDIPYPWMFHFYLGRSLYHSSVKDKRWDEVALERFNSLGDEERAWGWRGVGHGAAGLWIYTAALKGPDPLWSQIPSGESGGG
jgi:hypothetical protein